MVEKINRLIHRRLWNLLTAWRHAVSFSTLWLIRFGCGFGLASFLILPIKAQTAPSFISDDETEILLQQIIRPLFNAAGVPFDPAKIFIINDNSLNAFVSNGNYMFIHTGTLLNADNINELSGVLAHETGHIAGGHIVRQKLQIDKMKTLAVASLIAAGAAAAASGRGDAAMAVMLGSQSSLLNSLTAYQLQEERSADESAVKYLQKIGQSPEGLKSFMKKIQKSNRLNGYEEMPYFRTHPVSSERLQFFEQALSRSNGKTTTNLDNRFQLAKAKLEAFLLPVNRVWKLYPKSAQSESAQYAHAILYFREHQLNDALNSINRLIASHPQNPYYHELKGQFLFENGKVSEALKAYQTARKLQPDSPGIMMGWAQAALEAPHDKKQLTEILNTLNHIQIKRPNLTAWLLLARAYEEDNRPADALYASAQYSAGIGNFALAKRQLSQAEKIASAGDLKLKIKDLKNLVETELP